MTFHRFAKSRSKTVGIVPRAVAIKVALVLVIMLWFTPVTGAQQSEPFRPLIFVPGILGSELLDQNGDLIWGGAQSLTRFQELEIGQNGPARQLHVGGLVRTVNVLGPFWTIHQYDGLLNLLHDVGYKDDDTLFLFPYDWRYSNFETAQKLKAFIDEHPKLRNQPFDLLAHSMGGLVARIYLQTLGGENKIKRFISLGVPAQGAMNSLATMSEGWGPLKNILAGGLDSIRRVIFSFPSIYELFPSYDNCCRIGDEARFSTFDPTDTGIWGTSDWIPSEYTGSGFARIETGLMNARRLRELLRNPLSSGIEQTVIAGDRLATYLYLYVDPNDHSWRKWRFSKNRGDGTVPLWSAANGVLGHSLPAFVDHATIFDDKWVVNLLQRMFNRNSSPPPVAATNIPMTITNSGNMVEVSLIDATLNPPMIVSGDTSQMDVAMTLLGEVSRDEISPKVSLEGSSDNRTISLENVTTKVDLDRRVLHFSAAVQIDKPGPYSFRIDIPGLGRYAKDLLVLPRE